MDKLKTCKENVLTSKALSETSITTLTSKLIACQPGAMLLFTVLISNLINFAEGSIPFSCVHIKSRSREYQLDGLEKNS